MSACPTRRDAAYTVIELLIAVALLGILLTLVVPEMLRSIQDMKVTRSIADLRRIDFELRRYHDRNETWPDSLDDVDLGGMRDPWGHDYVYQVHRGAGWRGRARKDRFLVPLNSEYDLFSPGPNGEYRPPLNARPSRDDIVRAADGLFFGRARDF